RVPVRALTSRASGEFCLCFTLLIFNQLLDLTSQLGTRPKQLSGQIGSWGKDLPNQQRNLFLTVRPLTDGQDLFGGESLAVHHATLQLELGELIASNHSRDLFAEADEVFAAPDNRHRALFVFKQS